MFMSKVPKNLSFIGEIDKKTSWT